MSDEGSADSHQSLQEEENVGRVELQAGTGTDVVSMAKTDIVEKVEAIRFVHDCGLPELPRLVV